MFHIIPELLMPHEVSRLQQLAGVIRFENGRASNPEHSLKNNLQPSPSDAGYKEAAGILHQAMVRNEYFRDWCVPKTIAPPMMTKYQPGMAYGEHVDTAIIPYNPPLRIDISCTVFISPPESYEGGELTIRLADREVKVKEKPGAAVFYPSTFFHQVMPVTKGERVVGITFIESYIRDAAKRAILTELTEFLHENAAKVGLEQQVRLEYVKTNLMRMWHGN
ncbi:MAG: Fe2+-dependent dioxygenase [Alphaproteobacteria bacterium]|nr:MAG: Fe2+-dependent dioxygenase [Alphaproteobacteria bacterium]